MPVGGGQRRGLGVSYSHPASMAPAHLEVRSSPTDPAPLTTSQILREISSAREIVETRIAGMDKAIELLQIISDRIPEMIKEHVSKLHELHSERFVSINDQFKLRDVAVSAALKAAQEAVLAQQMSNKEANTKMETSFEKRIEQIGARLDLISGAFKDNIDDIKGRLTTIESRKAGVAEQKRGTEINIGMVISVIGLLVSIAAVIILFIHRA